MTNAGLTVSRFVRHALAVGGVSIAILLAGLAIIDLADTGDQKHNRGTDASQQGARIRFERTTYDAGEVLQGQIVMAEFIFHNAGTQPLFVREIHATCACTASLMSNEPIGPGDSSRVSVALDTATFEGPITSTVVIDTNDPGHTAMKLQLLTTVRPHFILSTPVLEVGQIWSDTAVLPVLEIAPTNPRDRVIAAESTARGLRARVSSSGDASNRTFLVHLLRTTEDAPGDVRGNLVVRTSNALVGELRVPIRGTLGEGLHAGAQSKE